MRADRVSILAGMVDNGCEDVENTVEKVEKPLEIMEMPLWKTRESV